MALEVRSLTFTPEEWDTPQVVTITPLEDDFQDGDMTGKVCSAPANQNTLNELVCMHAWPTL